MALFKGDVLIAGTNPSGGGGAGGGHVIQDSTGEEFEQRPALQFIGADVVDDDINEATQVITPSFREIQGDIPDTNLVCLDGIPIGGIIPYGAPINTLSADWLPALGQAVSRTFYHELFAKYGTTYGAGDGSTTFNLPNYGGKVPVGLDENDSDFDTLGETIGEKTHTLSASEIPQFSFQTAHVAYSDSIWKGVTNVTHSKITGQGTSGTNSEGQQISGNSGVAHKYTFGSDGAHNNIQPSIVANYIVKAKTSSHTITTSNVMTVYNESDENTYSTNYVNDNFQKNCDLTIGGRAMYTGRIINGMKEYVMILNCGNMPNNTSKSIPVSPSLSTITITRPVGLFGQSSQNEYPILQSGITWFISGGNLVITTTSDRSRFTCYAEIYFIFNI